uniref:BRCA2 n=1 Tax=Anisakis simplex TaxID=6269 RepID=A0A0M3JPK4_ANISI
LSTAQPSLAGEIPELGTQIALISKPPPPVVKRMTRKAKAVAYAMTASSLEDDDESKKKQEIGNSSHNCETISPGLPGLATGHNAFPFGP